MPDLSLISFAICCCLILWTLLYHVEHLYHANDAYGECNEDEYKDDKDEEPRVGSQRNSSQRNEFQTNELKGIKYGGTEIRRDGHQDEREEWVGYPPPEIAILMCY
ncbi:hypothetical protein M011DRAFT_474392 [Sporormia fimetaria CBS 119925]|uniref:Uncharacterized protein n=1 Tax=Sporormia fimetaria CBS 119925 TaxID=1340428 RepID=A0A6A6VME5_9PLEO|nr:hypothetical protein M011DRAFT_474392 [Sporormia fimetaria CBS 119925]